jgi:hypothetical protein
LLAGIDSLDCSASVLSGHRTRAAGRAVSGRDAERISEFWSYPQCRTFAELLLSCDEDRTLRAVLIGMLREGRC